MSLHSAVGPRQDENSIIEDDSNMASSSERTPLLASPSNTMPSRSMQYLAALSACTAAMAVGTTMGWTSAAEKPLTNSAIPGDYKIDSNQFSWVSAMLSIGAIVGAVPLGYLANIIGRKKVIILLAPFMSIGYLLLAFSTGFWMLLLGRFILGGVTGAYCVVVPMYTGEIAEPAIRGVLGSFFQLLITAGILLAYALNALNVSLLWINIVFAILPAIMAIMVLYFPDSPRWSISKGHETDARNALKVFRGTSDVEDEIQLIKDDITREREAKLPFSQAVSTTAAKKALFLALTVMLFQQFSGINAVIFYASQIFADAKVPLEESQCTVIVGVCQIIATYVSTLIIDRAGRKPLLISSGAIMAISGALLGLYFYLTEQTHVTDGVDISWLPIVSMVVFIILFSLGYGPIPWLYMGEVFSDQIKETGMSIATVVNWISVFIVTKFYGDLKEGIGGYGAFWVFSAISVLGCFFTFFFVLETKGKTFDQIQMELAGEKPKNLNRI
ncbi:Facilitated trehalose transporter Tret1 [Frankliniella fusca]|uniref:Facilitated trehalose transporter Tret1 n=2 Tax=Arthropoda TaxID=6656 RepID=A0AAE1I325_9NEOP|nr:Facilitated trehalose transporter Tret1 [Frankliniella fusca]